MSPDVTVAIGGYWAYLPFSERVKMTHEEIDQKAIYMIGKICDEAAVGDSYTEGDWTVRVEAVLDASVSYTLSQGEVGTIYHYCALRKLPEMRQWGKTRVFEAS
jgi:hypothetical protein